MGTRTPRTKGTAFLPVVTSLNAHPRGRQAVPVAMQRYLDQFVVATEWYPEDDFNVLLDSLAAVLQQDGMAGVWDYFGRVAAARDLSGSQDLVPAARRVQMAGVYRRFAGDEQIDVATAFRRLTKLWNVYHETGEMVIGRSPSDECWVTLRLMDYPYSSPRIVEMQTAYFNEYAGIVGVQAQVRIIKTAYDSNSFSEWECRCESSPEVARSLASLPKLL